MFHVAEMTTVGLHQSLIQSAHADRPQATGLKLPDTGILSIQLAQDCLSQSMSLQPGALLAT